MNKYKYRIVLFGPSYSNSSNSMSNYKLYAIFVIIICLLSHVLVIIFINVNEPMTLQCIFCTKDKFLQSGNLIQSSRLDLIIALDSYYSAIRPQLFE